MKTLLYILAIGLLVVHQDFWNFDKVAPLAMGVLPVGLWYHALYVIACSVLMGLLVTFAWPKHLERYGDTPTVSRSSQSRGFEVVPSPDRDASH